MTHTAALPHGRTRTLDTTQTGVDGSGNTVWIVWTTNADGTLHHMERFHSLDEAIAWIRWA